MSKSLRLVGSLTSPYVRKVRIVMAEKRIEHHLDLGGAQAHYDVTPDLAIWQGGMQIVPGPGAPPIKGHVVQVMKKVDERWLVLEAHPKFFPPPR